MAAVTTRKLTERVMEVRLNRTQVPGTFTGCMEEAMTAFQEGRPPRWRPLQPALRGVIRRSP